MYIQTNHTIKNLYLFDINKVCNDYITNHNKKNDFLVLNIFLK